MSECPWAEAPAQPRWAWKATARSGTAAPGKEPALLGLDQSPLWLMELSQPAVEPVYHHVSSTRGHFITQISDLMDGNSPFPQEKALLQPCVKSCLGRFLRQSLSRQLLLHSPVTGRKALGSHQARGCPAELGSSLFSDKNSSMASLRTELHKTCNKDEEPSAFTLINISISLENHL